MRRVEQLVIRVMILASVALAIVQLGQAKNPVDFYLAMAAKVENAPLDLPAAENGTDQTYTLSVKSVPNAPVNIWQNGVLLADLSQGEKLVKVQAGEIILDGRGAGSSVRVQIVPKDTILKQPRAGVVDLNGNAKSIIVSP